MNLIQREISDWMRGRARDGGGQLEQQDKKWTYIGIVFRLTWIS